MSTAIFTNVKDTLDPAPAQSFGLLAFRPQGPEAERIVALGEAYARVVRHQRAVVELRRCEVESAIEQQLASCGLEEVLAADDFGNAHGCIINHHGKLIRRDVVMPPDNEVAEVFAGYELLGSASAIHEGDDFAIGNAEAPVDSLRGGTWESQRRGRDA